MTLEQYFEEQKGVGVLSTADGEGDVNSAIYARPRVMEDGTLGFIMAGRRSFANLASNPKAAYLFMEEGRGYRGKRFHLTKVSEEQDTERVAALRRRMYAQESETAMKPVSLVCFRIDEESPLVGSF